ncbi:thymidylate synthase [Peptostreptococcus canis]|uniref:Thymidylate synthase n=1 Tax=Peptostreptococcus canis TaxID=1159213 RepID=A0ABR6TKV4_9FIRM|nr:thymidylate synthase [Peptostreptococcus canis]MBC2575873.1 thymidylate synthase [Peptostreptococcus canis]MBP1998007.1 thymidylate synthase [Peptostreptococcus canis]
MTLADKNFKKLCTEILESKNNTLGEKVRPKYADGTPSHTFFINQVFERYDLSRGELPIVTLRQVAWKSGIKEILWIYQDQSNDLNLLKEKHGITWWDEWDIGDRTIGQRYGATVKKYDLMNKLLENLKNQPYGRRHIINLYQEADLMSTKGLFPCAMETQWSVRDGYLDMTLIQRSSDVPVANAINKIQYVALQMMVARHIGLEPGVFCHYVNNAHIYDRHIEQVKEIISRNSQKDSESVKLVLNPEKTDFYSFTIEDFTLEGYDPIKPNLKFEMAI